MPPSNHTQNNPTFFERLVHRFLPHSWIFLLLVAVVTAAAYPKAVGLLGKISTELAKLLPDDHPTNVLGSEIKKKFRKRAGGDLVLLVSSSDIQQNQGVVDDLVAYLLKNPNVERVKYLKEGYDFFEKHKMLYLEVEDLEKIKDRVDRRIQKEKLGSLYVDFEEEGEKKRGDGFEFDDINDKYQSEYLKGGVKTPYYASSDGQNYALWIYPKSNETSLKFFKVFYDEIKGYVSKFPMDGYAAQPQLAYAGSIKTRIDEYTTLMNDLTKAGLLSIMGILLVLLAYFRRPVGIVLLFITLGVAVLNTFAVCSLFLSNLNVVTSFLFSILSGLGIEIGIHLFSRYIEERRQGHSPEKSIYIMVSRTGRAAISGVTLNCVTFFILVINQFRGFSEFGWIAGIGILLALLSYLTVFPSLLWWSEKAGLLRFKTQTQEDDHKTGWMSRWKDFPAAPRVVTGGLVLLLVFLATVPMIRFEWNLGLLKIQIPDTKVAREKLKAITGRVNSGAAIVVPNSETAEAIRDEVGRRKQADKDSPTIDFFKSYFDLTPKDIDRKMTLLKDIDLMLQDDALNVIKGENRDKINRFREAISKTKPFEPGEEVPQGIRESFFGKGEYSNEQVGFINPLPHLEFDDGRNARAFYEDIHEFEIDGKKYRSFSDSMVFAEVLNTMFADSKKVIFLTILFLLGVLYADFRSWKKVALAFGSVTWGVLGMIGIMYFFGMKFNFYNIIIVPLVLGMAVDSSVHLIHRYEELGKKSVMLALWTTGMAAGASSLTNLLGYSGLVVAHHPGLNSIGNLAVIGMLTCMVGSLVFLPAILQFISNRKK